MNYDHAFHAGNFADVFKHAIFACVIDYLKRKDAPFCVIDTHAGAGLYDLTGEASTRSPEWRQGVARLVASAPSDDVSSILAPYLSCLARYNGPAALIDYPGSPMIAQHLLRAQDRLVLCEKNPRIGADLQQAVGHDGRIRQLSIDGYIGLKANVPPKERRGLVLVDPPFEQKGEFARLTEALRAAVRKWSTGIYICWFPIKPGNGSDAFLDALPGLSARPWLSATLQTDGPSPSLQANGLAIINPTFGLREDIERLAAWLAPLLAVGPRFGWNVVGGAP